MLENPYHTRRCRANSTHLPLSNLQPVLILKRVFKANMKIPGLWNVYSAFSHIRSVCGLPPLVRRIPGWERLGASDRLQMKGRKEGEKTVMKQREETRGSRRGRHSLMGLVVLSGHARPPRPQLPVGKTCQTMFWVSHGKRACLSR